jgi:hypothetical protein
VPAPVRSAPGSVDGPVTIQGATRVIFTTVLLEQPGGS